MYGVYMQFWPTLTMHAVCLQAPVPASLPLRPDPNSMQLPDDSHLLLKRATNGAAAGNCVRE